MAKSRKHDPLPDLRRLGIIVAQEDDGSWFDLGRYGELETLGVSAMQRAQRARDELIRRAAVVCGHMHRNTTIADLRTMGVRGIRQHGIELVLEPKSDVFVVYAYDEATSGRGEALFWVFFAITILHPGGDIAWVRLPDENPEARVQLRIGGKPEVIGAIRETDWHAPEHTIWHGEDDDDADHTSGQGDRDDGSGRAEL